MKSMKRILSAMVLGATLAGSQIALGESLNETKVADSSNSTKVGARAGLVDIDGFGSTFGVGGYSEIELSKGLNLRPSLDYWQKMKSENFGYTKVDMTLSDLAIGGTVKYAFSLPGAKVQPYVLGGLALHHLSAEVKASSGAYEGIAYQSEASETKMGFDFGGGVAYPLSREMEVSAELMIRSVDAADLTTIMGGLSHSI